MNSVRNVKVVILAQRRNYRIIFIVRIMILNIFKKVQDALVVEECKRAMRNAGNMDINLIVTFVIVIQEIVHRNDEYK